MELRREALRLLAIAEPAQKAAAVRAGDLLIGGQNHPRASEQDAPQPRIQPHRVDKYVIQPAEHEIDAERRQDPQDRIIHRADGRK